MTSVKIQPLWEHISISTCVTRKSLQNQVLVTLFDIKISPLRFKSPRHCTFLVCVTGNFRHMSAFSAISTNSQECSSISLYFPLLSSISPSRIKKILLICARRIYVCVSCVLLESVRKREEEQKWIIDEQEEHGSVITYYVMANVWMIADALPMRVS